MDSTVYWYLLSTQLIIIFIVELYFKQTATSLSTFNLVTEAESVWCLYLVSIHLYSRSICLYGMSFCLSVCMNALILATILARDTKDGMKVPHCHEGSSILKQPCPFNYACKGTKITVCSSLIYILGRINLTQKLSFKIVQIKF